MKGDAKIIDTLNSLLAGELNDFSTRDVLDHILGDEDGHIDEIEALQDQISHMTLPVFLTTQVGK